MKAYPYLLLLVLAGCSSAAPGTDSFDETACKPLAGTFSGVKFTSAQATAVTDMIDHATSAELRAVPSIGPATASAILGARPYGKNKKPIAKLDAVSGIGPNVLTALRDNADDLWCAIADGRQSCCGGGSAAAPSMVINELSPGSKGWIELYNAGSEPVDLTGWAVDDVRPGGAKALPVAPGTTVPSHGYVVVSFGGVNVSSSDQVTLVDANGTVVDQTTNFYAGASLTGKCLSRVTDGGAWAPGPAACTPGASNGSSTCTGKGGTYDGATFTADAECQAVDFLNRARYSEMAALPATARHIAYDCQPAPTAADPNAFSCGYRSAAWTSLGQFSGTAGIGATALSGLKTSAATWQKNGSSYDTVATTWLARAALLDKPVSLDAVYVTKALADETGSTAYACVEVRDAPDATNYMAACVTLVNADSAPACASHACAQNMVGKWLRLRGSVKHSSFQPGGYKLNLVASVPDAADPHLVPGAGGPALDCTAIVVQAGEECGGLGYSESDCLFAYLASHDAESCTAELQGEMYDDT